MIDYLLIPTLGVLMVLFAPGNGGVKTAHKSSESAKHAAGALDFTMKTIDGKPQPLSSYKGKVVMIVNTASECGFTPQYETLEKLYETYKDKGFRILAFPANNFGGQEPGTSSDIKTFCSTKYHTTFDLFEK